MATGAIEPERHILSGIMPLIWRECQYEITGSPTGFHSDRYSEMINRISNPHVGKLTVALTLVLLPVLYFWPAVIGDVTLAPGDGWSQNWGIRVLIGQLLSNGQWPLWNPYLFAGMPLLADIQAGAFYPPNWLFAVFSPRVAINLVVITTYHIALTGTYLYGRRIGLNRLGAMVAGMVFSLGGFMVAHLGHTNIIATAAWLGWILLAIEELYISFRWRWVSLGALFVAMSFLAGAPQISLYTMLVASGYGIFCLTLRPSQGGRARLLSGLVAAAVCGVLISMIQLYPTLELLGSTEREKVNYDFFATCSLPHKQIYGMLFPYFLGGGAPPYRLPNWAACNLTEYGNYVGILALLLASAAVIGHLVERSNDRIVRFWILWGILALFLSLGSYMPFDIYSLLYKVPVYNLFRVPARHIFEITFAVGILAGFGVTYFDRSERGETRRVLLLSVTVISLFAAAGIVTLKYFSVMLIKMMPSHAQTNPFTYPEVYIPTIFLTLSIVALLIYWRRRSAMASFLLVATLLLDLMSFGFFYEWNVFRFDAKSSLADSPPVKLIKDREADLNAFRILSQSPNPWGPNSDLLNYPNLSIVRGLQSTNGYNPLHLIPVSEVAGAMGAGGDVTDRSAFNLRHHGFNLLNTRYLLYEKNRMDLGLRAIEGINFSEQYLNLVLKSGSLAQLSANSKATELAIISYLEKSFDLVDGTPVVKVRLQTADGQQIEREILAGRDTSEWDYDREASQRVIKHRRAPMIEHVKIKGGYFNRYLARIRFDCAQINRVDFEFVSKEGEIIITQASLYDGETRSSQPLINVDLPAERWLKLGQFGDVELYQNLKALPRAWFVRQAAVAKSIDVPRIIKSGRMMDGTPFDPSQTVLFEKEETGNPELPVVGDPGEAEAKITRSEPHRIELQTRTQKTGFLVLSEIHYPGWEAFVDGRPTPIERVDYVLRGISVPQGEHRVEFAFRSSSFRSGMACALTGFALLLIGAFLTKQSSICKLRLYGRFWRQKTS
jgi:Bacterial membrane protein YfhO